MNTYLVRHPSPSSFVPLRAFVPSCQVHTSAVLSASAFDVRRSTFVLLFSALAVLFCASCAKPSDSRTVVSFWHTQSGPKAEALRKIVDDFNNSQDRYRVVEQYVGTYDTIFRKMVVNIRAGNPPALAVAYESMVAKYHEAGAVVDLDEYLTHPDCGLSKESLADIYPAFIESNRFRHYGNKLLSFPFTKSVLMMYYNRALLEKLGFDGPPRTWDEFAAACKAVKDSGEARGYAISIDPSTIDAMVYSFGGDVLNEDETGTAFESPASRQVFDLLGMLVREGLGYMIMDNSYNDRDDLAMGRAAFFIRSSTSAPIVAKQTADLRAAGRPAAQWDLDIIPHGEGYRPVTVMFGANVCMLKTSPDVQRGAWEFIKYFTSRDVTADWAMKSGYLPVRKSAVEVPVLRDFLSSQPWARKPLDALAYSRSEPVIDGWQEIRMYIDDAERAVLTGGDTSAALSRLSADSNRLLAELNQGTELHVPAYFSYLFLVFIGGLGAAVWRLRKK